MISQKEGVYNAVTAFCAEEGIPFEDGSLMEFNKGQRQSIIGMLVEATEANELTVNSEKAQQNLPIYWNGCLSNWLRKDSRLNGNTKYITKNPGSRAGSGDPQLRELKKLLVQVQGTEHEATVAAEIESRQAIVQAEKVKNVEIDVDKLPEHLRALVS